MNNEGQQQGISTFTTPTGLRQAGNPFDWYREMRSRGGLHFDPERNVWDVFRYDTAQAVISNYKAFSSQGGTGGTLSLLGMDPPKHKHYRALVTQAFTQKSIENQSAGIEQIADELLDRLEGQPKMDFVMDFAFPLPVIVIAKMLGIRTKDRNLFKEWSDKLVEGNDDQNLEKQAQLASEKMKIIGELYAYFTNVIEERRANPGGNDLVSELLRAKIDDQHLDMVELLEFCLLLLVAGNETTTNLLGNFMRTMLEHPESLERVRKDRNLLAPAIEETLRYSSPIQSISRVASVDTEVEGQSIKAGQGVVIWLGSVNRDERKFDNAEQFIIDRHPNPHMGFGQSVHFCLGAPLARLEATIALNRFLDRVPSAALDESESLTRSPGSFVFGYKKLPLLLKEKAQVGR
ncbi:cytochrome P450 [Paenibacillus turpanensis]|uniref:cytochrome P450 n=1 Tax=Paenibacillus turpanensis TaxID=2689078 RepID=UPI00140A031C|nr:cytochrome P450 [Paenibacillus turpanensis]